MDLAEKVIQLEADLAVAKSDIGKLHGDIQKLASIRKTNPNVMDVFQKILKNAKLG